MDEQFLRKLSQKTAQIQELGKIKYRTKEETKELEQATKDLDQLVNTIKDNKELDQLQTLIDYCINYPEQDGKTLEEMYNQLDWREKHMSWLEYRAKQQQVIQEENELKIRRDIRIRQQKIDQMKAEEDEYDKEQQYITTKKDKEGLYQIKEEKYQNKLKALELKVQDARNWRERFKANRDLANLKSIKLRKNINNGMIKFGKGIRKVSGGINTVTEALDEVSTYSGYTKPKRTSTKSKSKSKKKGKKSRTKTRLTKDYNNNYGFSEKAVFDI